jgi:hypothetical protein
MYGAERADARALDQLEVVVRELADELASWRARALKAEGDLKAGGRGARGDGDGRGSDAEARALRQRLDAARTRIADLVARLEFLEEQTRAANGAGSGR